MEELTSKVTELLTNDDNFKQYISHIARTLENYENLYPEEYEKLVSEYNDDLGRILRNDQLDAKRKQRQIKNVILNTKNSIESFYKTTLRNSLEKMMIQPNQSQGVGPEPTSRVKDRVLPKPTPEQVKIKINSELNKIKSQILESDTSRLANSVDNLRQAGFTIRNRINNIVTTNSSVFDQQLPPPNLTLLLFVPRDQRTFEKQEINIANNSMYNFDEDHNTQRDRMYLMPVAGDPVEFIPMFAEERRRLIKERRSQLIPAKQIILVGNMPLIYTYSNPAVFYNHRYTILTEILYGMNTIANYFKLNETYIDLTKQEIERGNFKIIYSHLLPLIYVNNVNIIQYMIWINKLLPNVINKLIEITNEYRDYLNTLKGINGTQLKQYKVDFIIENLENVQENLESLKEDLQKTYNELKVYKNLYALIITYINKKSSSKVLENFITDNFNENTTTFDKIFDRKIKTLPILPERITDITEKLQTLGTLEKKRKYYYETIIPNVSKYNYQTFYDENRNNNGIEFVFSNYPNELGTRIRLMYRETIPRNGLLVPTLSIDNDMVNLGIDIDQIDLENQEEIEGKLEESNGQLGKVGLQFSFLQKRKDKEAVPIVSNHLDNYFYIIKYEILRQILYKFRLNQPEGNSFIELANKVSQNLVTTYQILEEDISSTFYTILAQISEEILSTYFNYTLQKSSLRIANSIANLPSNNRVFSLELSRGVQIDNLILNIDSGFELNLNSVFKELTNKYLETERNVNSSSGLYYTNIPIEDDFKIKKQHQLININTTLNESVMQKNCYEINTDLIEFLAKNDSGINKQDSMGKTPIYYAIDMQHPSLVKLLRSHGAFTSGVTDVNMRTPITYLLHDMQNHI
ncbi:MAG: hypothetical protein CMF62_02275 [Magnetococcales bacterium]|nr:hypothetical protein [Magnetococcales bacterium]